MNKIADSAVTSIKLAAVRKAIAMLQAAQAQYKIITHDGQEFGSLAVKPQPKRHRTGTDYKSVYFPVINGMQAGDAKVIFPPSGMSKDGLRGAIAGYCSHAWGNGTYITSTAGDGVEVLRVL